MFNGDGNRNNLGSGSWPHRDEGQAPQLSHLVPARHCSLTDGGNCLSIRVPNLLVVEWLAHYTIGGHGRGAARGRPCGCDWCSFPTASGRPSTRSITIVPRCRELPVGAVVSLDANHAAAASFLAFTFDSFIVGASNQFALCGLPRGGGDSVAIVQPAVHSRRRGTRQDAPDARDWSLRGAASSVVVALHLVRTVYEQDDQCNAV